MGLLKYLFVKRNPVKKDVSIMDPNNSLQEVITAHEKIAAKYAEALKFYCPECKRGFDKKNGKSMHMRWVHENNPPIIHKKVT